MNKAKFLSLILCVILAATMLFAGCRSNSGDGNSTEAPASQTGSVTNASTDASGGTDKADTAGVTEIGEGKTQFTFIVTNGDGVSKTYSVKTDETTVGAALLKLDLISGEKGAYGLYVKTVDGITADYDTDGTYWSFYIDGEYALTGVDSTEITAGSEYALKIESMS